MRTYTLVLPSLHRCTRLFQPRPGNPCERSLYYVGSSSNIFWFLCVNTKSLLDSAHMNGQEESYNSLGSPFASETYGSAKRSFGNRRLGFRFGSVVRPKGIFYVYNLQRKTQPFNLLRTAFFHQHKPCFASPKLAYIPNPKGIGVLRST